MREKRWVERIFEGLDPGGCVSCLRASAPFVLEEKPWFLAARVCAVAAETPVTQRLEMQLLASTKTHLLT